MSMIRERVATSAPSGPLLFVLVGAGYLALAQYVIILNDPVHLGAGFWPAAGLTLGVLLLLPGRRWPWGIAAIAAAEFGGDLAHGYPVAAALWWTAGNCVEPLLGAMLIRRFADPRGALVPVRNTLLFLLLGVIIAPVIGASVGTIGTTWIMGKPLWQVWPKYVIGDALGVLVIAPVLLTWLEPRSRRSLLESASLVVSLTAVCVIAFRNWPEQWLDVIAPYLIVPMLTWAALRFGIRGAAWAVLLTANVANIATALGYGPFAIPGEPSGHAITLLQIFLVITATTALILAALVDDLTDRRAAEAELRAREQVSRRQAELLEKARDAIVELDMELRVRFWNRGAERIYGWRREEVLGQLAPTVGELDATDFRAAVAGVLQHGEWVGRIRQPRKDGGVLTIEGHWSLVRDEHEQPRSILAINTDITQRVALEEQIRQVQHLEAVGQLTGGVAHDFNNLLTVIVGNSERLVDALHDRPQMRALAEAIGNAADRGAQLIRQMLAFGRRQRLQPQCVDVDACIDAIQTSSRLSLPANVVIERRREPQPWQVLLDPMQFEAALISLVANAVDAMPDGGTLRIETANVRLAAGDPDRGPEVPPGSYLKLTVCDTGCGIAAEHLERVFDPFFTTKAVGEGSGLGLSMVYGFIKQSDGHVTVHTEPGRGTTVCLYLPLDPACQPESGVMS